MNPTLSHELLNSLGLIGVDGTLNNSALTRDWKRLRDLSLERLLQNGDFSERHKVIQNIPLCRNAVAEFNREVPSVCSESTLRSKDAMLEALASLGHWKKGPFSILGTRLDGEWQSQLKWQRVLDIASPLSERRVLDVGTGNGYFLYRAHGEGAQFVLGIEPSGLYVAQYLALQRCFQCPDVGLLPLSAEDFTLDCAAFDTVFSMGVLYHRRSPLEHLARLRSFLTPGGELILETIVVDGELGYSLLPPDRYAQMRNVWFLPSVPTLESWLLRVGFRNVKIGDVVVTTHEEQHSTPWTGKYSLKDFLDPETPSLTVEALPAPKRVIMTAIAP